jgi:membrane protease YdiL (CAAX protease family)
MRDPWTEDTYAAGPAPGEPLTAELRPVILLALALGCFLLDQALLFASRMVIGAAAGLLVASTLGVLVPVWTTCWLIGVPVLPATMLRRIGAREAGLTVWAVSSVLAPAYALAGLGARYFPPNPEVYEFFASLVPSGLLALLVGGVAIVVVAPLAEEIIFRLLVLGSLLRLTPAGLGVAASALLFAATHGAVSFFAPIALLGLLLGLLVWRTGKLTPAWLGHGIFNLVGYADLCLTQDAQAGRLERWSLQPWVLAPSVVSLVAVAWILVRGRRPRPPDRGDPRAAA